MDDNVLTQAHAMTILSHNTATTNKRSSSSSHTVIFHNGSVRRKPGKVTIYVCVMFLKIGEIDTIKEQYSADVLIKAKWREPFLDKKSQYSGKNALQLRDWDHRNSTSSDDIYSVPNYELKASCGLSSNSNTTVQTNADEIDFSALWNPELYIDNVIGDARERVTHSVLYSADGEAWVLEKRHCTATFMENLELQTFPFDVQDLSVTVSSQRVKQEVELQSDPDDIHKINRDSFVDEQEWHLYEHVFVEQTQLHVTEGGDALAVRHALCVKARGARRPAYFIWNMFLTTFLICLLAFTSFSVDPAMPQNRLQLSFTLVLTGVTFKFVVNQGLPRISYLTYLDKYVIATMLILTAVSIWHAVIAFLISIDRGQFDYNLIERYVLIGMSVLYVLFNICFAVAINIHAISRRREMKLLDEEYRRVLLAMSRTKQRHASAASSTGADTNHSSTERPSRRGTYQNPMIQVEERG